MMDRLLGEAAYLLREMGFAASHLTRIGGMVPGLLVPSLDPGMPAHVGTADLNLCIGIAIVEGDVAEYQKIETSLQSAGYHEDGSSWRWRGGESDHVIVKFFCPSGPGREAGRLFRPKGKDNPRAKRVMGGSLSALALAVSMRPSYARPEVPSALDILADQFRDFRSTGAVNYARFIAGPDDALIDLAQRSVGALREFLRGLPGR